MLRPGPEDELLTITSIEELNQECFQNTKRKSSFIDLLSPPSGIPEDPLIDLHSDSSDWKLPEIFISGHEFLVQELNLDLLDLHCPKSKTEIIKQPVQVVKYSSEYIGTLTVEQRKEKIAKYLEKRKKRTWRKRIYYDCRKKVADKRLRVKGRFVTKDQAINKLGPEVLKQLL